MAGNYLKGKVLGEGTWGHVYEATRQSDGATVAIKRIKPKDKQFGLNFTALREIKYLKQVKSKYIVDFTEAFQSDGILHLVLEFCPFSLEHIIRDKSIIIRSNHVKNYIQMILSGLECLHQNFILHRDLKPANLLIGRDGLIKLADFGLARAYGSPNHMTSEVVSLWYRSPELLFGAQFYGAAVDIWSAGCIFAEIILRTALFAGEDETSVKQLAKIFNIMGTPTPTNWPNATTLPNYIEFDYREPMDLLPLFVVRGSSGSSSSGGGVKEENNRVTMPLNLELLLQLLKLNPLSRPTATDALKHPYFKTAPVGCPVEDLPLPGGVTLIEKRKIENVVGVGEGSSMVPTGSKKPKLV